MAIYQLLRVTSETRVCTTCSRWTLEGAYYLLNVRWRKTRPYCYVCARDFSNRGLLRPRRPPQRSGTV